MTVRGGQPWRRLPGIVLGMIALAEILVRALGAAPPVPKLYRDDVFVSDPVLPYRLAPGIHRTVTARTGEFRQTLAHNRDGFRDVDHDLAKPAGTFRILGVGDSFTYGAGADFTNTYLHVLEQSLQAAMPTTRVEIIKAGIGGFSTESERLLVERYGLAYEPDLILVGFNATDLFEVHLGMEHVRVYEGYLKNADARRLGYVGTWLVLHSHLARALHHAVRRDTADDLHRRFESSPEAREDAWRRVSAELRRLRDAAAASGARVVVCFLPLDLDQFRDDLDRLRAACAPLGLRVVDTSGGLIRAARDGPVFWPRDGHYTPLGYRAVARAIHDALAGDIGIPPP